METQEIWKDIPNYEGIYQVSNLGRVKSLERVNYNQYSSGRKLKEKILKPSKDSTSYLTVGLSKNGIVKTFKVHKLVAIAFLNHTPNGHKIVVDHINNISTDNRVDNLQIVSHRQNISKDIKGYSSDYVGVCWSKTANKWRSDIMVNGKIKYLGYFKYEYDAHLAYQKELKKIKEL